MINEVLKYHKDWLRVSFSFTNNLEDAEDIVQEMYLKIFVKSQNNTLNNIRYKDTINKYFIYKMLKNMCIDKIRKSKKIGILNECDSEDCDMAKNEIFEKIDNEIEKLESKEKEIFKLYMYSKITMKELSVIHNTSKSTIFNYIKKGKQKIKESLSEDMEDYFNNDFDYI